MQSLCRNIMAYMWSTLLDFRKMIEYKKKVFNANMIPGTFSIKWPEMFWHWIQTQENSLLVQHWTVSSVTQLCLCNPTDCSTPGFLVHHQLPELAQIHVHQVGDAIQPSHPLSWPSPLAFDLYSRVFSNESTFAKGGQSIGFSFNISPSNEYPGLISSRMDWLDLLAVQGTFKIPLQHHSSKTSILRSNFFMVQLSDPYMTTGKTIALTRWTFVGKVMSAFQYAV